MKLLERDMKWPLELEDLSNKMFGEFFNFANPTNTLMVLNNDKDKTVFTYDLPGHNKENIKITTRDGYLSVVAKTGKRDDSLTNKFHSVYDLPSLKAKYQDGVLYLTIPKVSAGRGETEIIIE